MIDALAFEVVAAVLGGLLGSTIAGAVGVWVGFRRMERALYEDAAVAHDGGLVGAVRSLKRRVRRHRWALEQEGIIGKDE